ncbi:NK-tumor recognition protein-like isoform X1 [Ruditapes philippinarum]|uniref:NK-tumor recognition protein-like isoform X1 n=1 Tax=Ruditapes philippinarum TaxID=129788 RepID=UPI00295C04C9|nr:NK-tumor recognition protein-like isoform X1 [Ruditapes philippinarum]
MPMRKYYLVGDGTAINMRQKLARERAIRSVSITSNGENVGDIKSGYVCEVRKSPRAPEYEVHYVKTKRDGIKMIRSRKNPVPKSTDSIPIHSTDYDSKTESEITDKETDDMVGLRVIACNKQDGLYYPGSVGHTAEATYAVVNFNNKKRQKVRTQMIIPMSGAIPRPELAPGDFVLVRVFNQSLQSECYVPAIVEVTPEDARHHAKFYSVLLYNGQRETTMRKFIVKIGKARFEMAIRYIAHIQQQKILRQESALSENSSMPSPQSQSSKKSEDDASSTRSSQSGRGRRKKEKITKKLVVKKEKTETQKKKRKNKSRSRSRSRSQSSKSSRSRSRSSSRSSSRSRSQSSRSQSERSRSRSGSSRSRSRSSSRSYSSRSRSRSSRSSERSGRSRERSSRSRTSSKSSRSRSRSRDSDRSKGSLTPRAQSPYDRPHRPTPTACRKSPLVRTDSMLDSETITRKDIYNERRSRQSFTSETSKMVNVDEKDEMIQALQYQLEKQKRKQLRQERRLVRQARKINKISRKIKESDTSHNESGQSSHSDRTDKARNRRSSTSSSEEDTSPQRRNGSPDGTSYGESPDVQSQQRSSPGLRVNQEVLARWNDDGWYYRGSVMVEGKDNKYIIRDSTGYMETISREDILTESEHKFDAIQPEDHVIGLHPKYVFSYAPAEVLGTYSNSTIKVEFFDGNIAKLTEEEVYKIPKAKYNQVIEYIKKCEKNLIGRSVVAREDVTGLYKLAVVDSRVGLGQQYYLKWLDGDMSKQNANHIFEVGKKQTRHEDWSHVLAPISQHSMTFMPAEVIDTNPLVVQFCNGKRSTDATFDQCFWLSKDYYNNARGYIMEMKYQNIRESHSDRNGE